MNCLKPRVKFSFVMVSLPYLTFFLSNLSHSQEKPNNISIPKQYADLGYKSKIDSQPDDENWDNRFGPNDDLDDYDESVHAIAVADSEIYIGGVFWVRGVPHWNGIAIWNGQGWSSLGRGVGGRGGKVNALAIIGNDLYVGGSFSEVDGEIQANNIAKWNRAATTWSALESKGDYHHNGTASALVAHRNNLYVGSGFAYSNGTFRSGIAEWSPSTNTWAPLGTGIDGFVGAIAVKDSVLYAGGRFAITSGIALNNIAEWDGQQWSPLGVGVNGEVTAIAILGNEVYVGGYFTKAGEVEVCNLAKWNALTKKWASVGNNVRPDSHCYGVNAMAASNGFLYVGGVTEKSVANLSHAIAKWNPITGSWMYLGSGLDHGVKTILSHGEDIYVGGYFTQAGGKSSTRFAIWHEPEQNHAPVINSSLPTLSFNEDVSLLYPISKWHSRVQDQEDADSTLVFTVLSGKKVQATRQGNDYLFTAPENWFGQNKLKLIVTDRSQLADTAEFVVRVKPVNDPPVITNLPESITFRNDTSKRLSMWDFVSDVEDADSTLGFSFSASNDSLKRNFDAQTGMLTLTAPGFIGKANLFLTVRDDSNAVARDTIAVNVDRTTSVAESSSEIPTEFVLLQNHPNPFNPTTAIRFGLPHASAVQLEVFDLSGQRVAVLLNEHKPAGFHAVEFDASSLSSGTYFYKITAGSFAERKKLLLVK